MENDADNILSTSSPALLVQKTETDAFDPIALLLADKRSSATKRAYAADLAGFFKTSGFESAGQTPAPTDVQAFLQLTAHEAALRLATYKGEMLTAGLSEATVNRRLAAVRSLLKFSHRLGLAKTDGRGLVDSERVQKYRDTRGTDIETLKRLLTVAHAARLPALPQRKLHSLSVCSSLLVACPGQGFLRASQ